MKILILGDIMLGENMFHLNRGILSNFENKYDELIPNKIRDTLLSNIDAIFYNMEYSLYQGNDLRRRIPKDRVYRAKADSLNLFDSRISSIANVANNHFSQHGEESSKYTKKVLREHWINYLGDKDDPHTMEFENSSIKMWGYSMVKDNFFCNQYNLLRLDTLPKAEVKKDNEFWAISLHWGDEYITYPSVQQVNYAHALIDMGFDLIIGHHPHVIQPTEYYKNGLIIYSLGNFIFDQNFSKTTQEGLVVKVDTDNLKKCKFYKTTQKNFRISFIEDTQEELTDIIANTEYSQTLEKEQIKARKKMKKEYLKNIFRTDIRVIPHIISKQFNK